MSKIIKFNVHSAGWSKEIYVDSEVFEDVYVEAATQCIEQKMKEINKTDSDFLINPIIVVKPLTRKNSKQKILNTYKILLNASMQNKAELLREIFYSSTSIDLALEPLSSSKL